MSQIFVCDREHYIHILRQYFVFFSLFFQYLSYRYKLVFYFYVFTSVVCVRKKVSLVFDNMKKKIFKKSWKMTTFYCVIFNEMDTFSSVCAWESIRFFWNVQSIALHICNCIHEARIDVGRSNFAAAAAGGCRPLPRATTNLHHPLQRQQQQQQRHACSSFQLFTFFPIFCRLLHSIFLHHVSTQTAQPTTTGR